MCRKDCKERGSGSAPGVQAQRETPSPNPLYLSAPNLLSSLTVPGDWATGKSGERTGTTLLPSTRLWVEQTAYKEQEPRREGVLETRRDLWSSGVNQPSSFWTCTAGDSNGHTPPATSASSCLCISFVRYQNPLVSLRMRLHLSAVIILCQSWEHLTSRQYRAHGR